MKKMQLAALAVALSAALVGCNGGGSAVQQQTEGTGQTQQITSVPAAEEDVLSSASGVEEDTPAPAPAEGSPEAILEQIQQDFAKTQQSLLDEQAAVASQAGATFDGYVANAETVQGWYDLAVSETEALGSRTIENARNYYRAVVDTVDHGDDDALDDALDDFYDLIYDDAFDDYYDVIYDDGFDDMYDAYYDGSIEEGYDTLPYDEWYDIKSDAYESWFDAKSDVYEGWFDAKSDIYEEWFDVNSGFYSNEFDIDEILRLDDAS